MPSYKPFLFVGAMLVAVLLGYVTVVDKRMNRFFLQQLSLKQTLSLSRAKAVSQNDLDVALSSIKFLNNAPNNSFQSDYLVEAGENTDDKRNKKLIYVLEKVSWLHDSFERCPYACEFIYSKTLREKADAMLVHVSTLMSKTPPTRPLGQIWIAMGLESPVNYLATYRRPAWRGVFNWTMMYRTDSDIFYPYGYLAPRTKLPKKDYLAIAAAKTKTVAWFVSNCNTQSSREEYVSELRKHIDVDIFGRCGTFSCPREAEKECLAPYRFYLSFENSICKDYVTEKFFKTFSDVDVIPVVRGGADYHRIFPEMTFIDASDFHSPKALAEHLLKVAADPSLVAAMLKRKDRYRTVKGQPAANCQLCRMLHNVGDGRKTYTDLPRWVSEGACWPPK